MVALTFALGAGEWESSLAMPYPWPNIPVERTAHSAGFVVVPGLGGCGPPLTAGVDMTSDVKSRAPLFLRLHSVVSFVHQKSRSQEGRRVITLLSVGWLPPSWPPSGACLMRGTSVPGGLCT